MSEVRFQVFKGGSFTSWGALFSEVAAVATQVGKQRIISIRQSEDENTAVATVWHWA